MLFVPRRCEFLSTKSPWKSKYFASGYFFLSLGDIKTERHENGMILDRREFIDPVNEK
jgi:hypothetical protein